jgi:uncharacterized membrane protein YfcA
LIITWIFLSNFSATNIFLIFIGAFIIGLAKAGLKGIDMLNVTIMAIVFGGKASTGIVLPLLCIADIGAVLYYNRHAQWKYFWKIIPWMAIGILVGVYVGRDIDENLFRKIMAGIIIITVIIMLLMEARKSFKVPANALFVSTTGLAAGFTTMLGNLAGAFANIYFLALRMPKNGFIGTGRMGFPGDKSFQTTIPGFSLEKYQCCESKSRSCFDPRFGIGILGRNKNCVPN